MKFLAPLFAVFAMFAVSTAADAREPEVSLLKPSLFGGEYKNALNGYDAVSYWTAGKPQKGNKKFSFSFKDRTWLFTSQENLDKFKADPDKYRPAYGNYCAYALANGQLAAGDPKAWHIHEGKLYLNYNKSIQKKWLKDVPGHLAKSEPQWPVILDK